MGICVDELRTATSYCIKNLHEYGFADVSDGTELEIGVSREALDQAVQNLVHNVSEYTLETVTGRSITNPEYKVIAQILKYRKENK